MKQALLLYHNRDRSHNAKSKQFGVRVADRLKDSVRVMSSDIDELFFEVSNDVTRIYHPSSGYDVADFDLVAFRHVSTCADEAHAITIYCEKKGIRYIDSYLNRPTLDKMSASFLHWTNDIPVPHTLFGPIDEMTRRMSEFGEFVVVKDNHGFKGEKNFLLSSPDELKSVIDTYSDTKFVMQKLIPNEGDYRILVFNYKPVLAIKRQGSNGEYLNNTSKGGTAEIVAVDSLSDNILDMCIKASKAEKLEVAGVDIIIDKDTNRAYVLEVNQAPQVSSGSFLDEKLEKYCNMLKELV